MERAACSRGATVLKGGHIATAAHAARATRSALAGRIRRCKTRRIFCARSDWSPPARTRGPNHCAPWSALHVRAERCSQRAPSRVFVRTLASTLCLVALFAAPSLSSCPPLPLLLVCLPHPRHSIDPFLVRPWRYPFAPSLFLSPRHRRQYVSPCPTLRLVTFARYCLYSFRFASNLFPSFLYVSSLWPPRSRSSPVAFCRCATWSAFDLRQFRAICASSTMANPLDLWKHVSWMQLWNRITSLASILTISGTLSLAIESYLSIRI